MARGALGPVLPAEHLVLAGERRSAGPGQDLAELDELAVGRWVGPVGQDQVEHGPRGLLWGLRAAEVVEPWPGGPGVHQPGAYRGDEGSLGQICRPALCGDRAYR